MFVTADIAVEAFQNGSPSSPISHHYKDPTYRSSADYDTVDPTFVISVTSEKEGAEKGASISGAGNYEEPMVLRSGSNGIQVSLGGGGWGVKREGDTGEPGERGEGEGRGVKRVE